MVYRVMYVYLAVTSLAVSLLSHVMITTYFYFPFPLKFTVLFKKIRFFWQLKRDIICSNGMIIKRWCCFYYCTILFSDSIRISFYVIVWLTFDCFGDFVKLGSQWHFPWNVFCVNLTRFASVNLWFNVALWISYSLLKHYYD